MAAHLPRVLQEAGASLAAAVAAAALVGPAQVTARVLQVWLMRRGIGGVDCGSIDRVFGGRSGPGSGFTSRIGCARL